MTTTPVMVQRYIQYLSFVDHIDVLIDLGCHLGPHLNINPWKFTSLHVSFIRCASRQKETDFRSFLCFEKPEALQGYFNCRDRPDGCTRARSLVRLIWAGGLITACWLTPALPALRVITHRHDFTTRATPSWVFQHPHSARKRLVFIAKLAVTSAHPEFSHSAAQICSSSQSWTHLTSGE